MLFRVPKPASLYPIAAHFPKVLQDSYGGVGHSALVLGANALKRA